MKLLVVGLGSIGRRHVRNARSLLGPGAEIVAYRARGAERVEDVRSYDDLDRALAEGPEAALVCNPTSLHVPVALRAAEAGCHLFIEKPVSHAREGLDRLAALVRERGLRVLVGYQLRFHPGLRAVRELIEEGAVGPVVHAQAHWGEYLPDWHPGEDYRQGYSARAELGGGVILTLSHPLDYLRWLLGEVRSVSAAAGRASGLELDVEDTADIALRFESGALGAVHLDYVRRPPSHGLRITGRSGTIEWDDRGAVRLYRAGRGDWETIPPPAGFERNAMFVDEMRHFLDCVAGRSEPLVGLADGVRVLEIALAARRSAAEGRTIEVGDE